MSYYPRYPLQAQIARNAILDRQVSTAKAIQRQRALQQSQYRRFKEVQNIRAEKQFLDYVHIQESRKRMTDEEILKDRLLRQHIEKERRINLEAQRIARQQKEKQIQLQKKLAEEQKIRNANLVAQSRRIQHQNKVKRKQQANIQNLRVLEEQKQQELLERQITDISLELGSIFDERQARKKLELIELQKLDEQSTKIKRLMRSSKVKQKALQDEIQQHLKIIGKK